MDEQIAELLAEGYGIAKVSSITGVPAKIVKEKAESPEIIERINYYKSRAPAEVATSRYGRIENLALKTIEENLAFADIGDAVKVLDTVNKKRATEAPAPPSNGNTVNIFNVALPPRLVPKESEAITLNANGEIVAVGARSFAPLDSDNVKLMFSKLDYKVRQQAKVLNEDDI